jgi:hypothetical protein
LPKIVVNVRFVGSEILMPGVYDPIRFERILMALDELGGPPVVCDGKIELTVASPVPTSEPEELITLGVYLQAAGEDIDRF